jgi:RNA polymerase-binding transcription factor DksA
MDEVDRTQERLDAEELLRQRQRAAAAAKSTPTVENCLECEAPIEPIRKAFGFQFCIECATALERRAKGFRQLLAKGDSK